MGDVYKGGYFDGDYRFRKKKELAGLLRFETTNTAAGETISLKNYISRMPESQKVIHFLFASEREIAESSPYIELFKKRGEEVLFCFTAPDELCMRQIMEYDGKELRS